MVDLPPYPATVPVRTSDERTARQSATWLLVFETVVLGLSLPIQFFLLLWLGWEGGDEALKHRLLDALPLLGMGGLVAAVLCGISAFALSRETHESTPLAASAAGLVGLLGLGWVAALQGTLVDPLLGTVWVVMTSPAPAALVLLHVVRRRVRPADGSPPRSPASGGVGAP